MGEKKDYLRKYQSRRYQTRRFRNPYFQGAKKRPALRWKQWLMLMAGGAVAIGFVWLIGFAPFWMIHTSRVDGLQFMDSTGITQTIDAQMATRRWLIIPNRNRLFFSEKALTDALSKQFSFESLNVNVVKKTVVVTVKERVSQVLWMTDGQALYTDMQGTIIRALSEADQANLVWHGSTQPSLDGAIIEGPYPQIAWLSSLPLIKNKEGKPAVPGDHMMTPASIAGIIAMSAELSGVNLPVRDFVVDRSDSVWASARLLEGFEVLFDTTADTKSQTGYLTDVLQKSVPDRSTLDYVDVRFGNHVYFKSK